ncbi:SPFH domain-containing protein [Streptomyces sp. NPDC050421]|uniref:SPFH domain-containing protein n=1 Tax=Streptomyces sp. NPDC050421 TaxID=3365613 RepID=UPI0037B8AA98
MRSTVSDSSGNPENREEPEYGEERYGAVPVREWVGPEGAGRVTDAWAAAGERAGSGGWAVEDEKDAGPGAPALGTPVVAEGSGPDSVVDLVLDLVPGEAARERRGSGFGATSASVSVPAADPGPAPDAVPAVDAGPAPVVVPAPVAIAVPAVGVAASAPVLPGVPGAPDAPEDSVAASVAETGVLVMVGGAAFESYGSARSARSAREVPEPPAPSEADEVSASVPGPGLAPASLSLTPTGEDTGEFRTDTRVDTGRHQAVIANERTASIPVHLLFREGPESGADAAALPATVVRKAPAGEQPAGVRRPPVPRTPQVRPSTRPAPVADPRLRERPGPSLPGWVALLTGFGGIAVIGGALWWTGALPARVLSRLGVDPRPYDGLGLGTCAGLALLVTVVLFAFGGLSRGRVGYTWVLTLFGRYRGSVRRTGLMWVSPLLLRRRVDVRLRHWRSEPLPAMDANGTALRVVVLVVWRVEDTVRATLGIEDHEEYLREQVEAAMARVLSQLPADAFHEDAHTLRNAEAVGDALTRMLKADCEPVGVEVYSAQPTGIEYAPEVAAAMQRRRIAAIDAKHRDSVLTSVVDAVDDTVSRLTARGLVELDDYERKSLVKDLTVAFYTGRTGGESA